MEKALAVANELIELAQNAGKPPTQMKLQKLMFFAHGWNLALFDEPLIDEEFQAWKFGPVVPSVYREFRNFGVFRINRMGQERYLTPSNQPNWYVPRIAGTGDDTRNLLERIWEVFGGYTGTQLSVMTHAEDTPWTKARQGRGEDERNIPIPNSLIKQYFDSFKDKV